MIRPVEVFGVVLASLLLAGCGDNDPKGSTTPGAMESGRPSTGVDRSQSTPMAPDTPAGGSAGPGGLQPGTSSGQASPGSGNTNSAPNSSTGNASR